MKTFGESARAALMIITILLSGCAAIETSPSSAPTASSSSSSSPEETEQARVDLATGIARYESGDYVDAIRKLHSSGAIWTGLTSTRVTAYKYIAFSECVLKRTAPCRQSFTALLRLDPSFTLSAAEAGHPQWGAAFRQARSDLATLPPAGPGRSPAERNLSLTTR